MNNLRKMYMHGSCFKTLIGRSMPKYTQTTRVFSTSLIQQHTQIVSTELVLTTNSRDLRFNKNRPIASMFHTSQTSQVLEDNRTKALTIWTNLKEVRSSPVPALSLGLSGLIPFIAAPAYIVSQGVFCPDIAFAQVAYGASILSFLGGVRWGFTIPEENPVPPDWVNLGYSVAPSLIAWTGLLLPSPYSLLTVMGGLVFAGYFDMAMYGYPPWFKGLRFTLSFIAILSLWTTFMCKYIMAEKNKSTGDSES